MGEGYIKKVLHKLLEVYICMFVHLYVHTSQYVRFFPAVITPYSSEYVRLRGP